MPSQSHLNQGNASDLSEDKQTTQAAEPKDKIVTGFFERLEDFAVKQAENLSENERLAVLQASTQITIACVGERDTPDVYTQVFNLVWDNCTNRLLNAKGVKA